MPALAAVLRYRARHTGRIRALIIRPSAAAARAAAMTAAARPAARAAAAGVAGATARRAWRARRTRRARRDRWWVESPSAGRGCSRPCGGARGDEGGARAAARRRRTRRVRRERRARDAGGLWVRRERRARDAGGLWQACANRADVRAAGAVRGARGSDEGSGATGMMVTARVADSWGGQGEAPFSAPQAKKILRTYTVLLQNRVNFEWVSHLCQAQ